MKTIIKQANWKSKTKFSKKNHNIVTTVYYQGKDVFIDSDSKLLFQMICENFFNKYKNVELKISLKDYYGYMFPQAYRLYVYNLIYKELTGKKIKNDIFQVKKEKKLFYRVMLDTHTKSHKKMVLKIIKILKIDFKKESNRLSRVLFNMKKKKNFYLCDE
jgi:hypothetical protein